MPPSKKAPDAAPARRSASGVRAHAEFELPDDPPARTPTPRAGRSTKAVEEARAQRHPEPRAVRIPNYVAPPAEPKPRAGRSAKNVDAPSSANARAGRRNAAALSSPFAQTTDDLADDAAWPPGPRRSTLLQEGRAAGRFAAAANDKQGKAAGRFAAAANDKEGRAGGRLAAAANEEETPAPRSRVSAASGRVSATARLVSTPQRATPARPVRKRTTAAKSARTPRRGSFVPTEAGLLWGLLYDLLCAPLWLIGILRGRAKWRDGMRPLDRLLLFVLSARMTALLITLNLLVFGFEIYTRHAGWSRAAFVAHFALSTDGLGRGEQLPLLTHFFSHASPMHLFGNMLALFVFGRVVERNLGPWRLLACYLLAAVCSTALSLLAQGLSGRSVPTLGASGAVAGLVALGILLEPLTLTFEALVPMPLFLVGWLAIAADFAALLGPGGAADAVDHPAHLGGYLSVLLGYYALQQKHQQQARLGLLINLATLLLMAGMWFFWGSRGG